MSPFEPCFVAISSRQPGNTSAQIAHPPDRQLGNRNPGEAVLSSRHPEELKGQAQPGRGRPGLAAAAVGAQAGVRAPCAHACRQCCLAGDTAWQDTLLAVLLETSVPREPSGALRFPFSGTAEGKTSAGPRPIPSCQPLAGSSLLELSSLPSPERGQVTREGASPRCSSGA